MGATRAEKEVWFTKLRELMEKYRELAPTPLEAPRSAAR